MMHDRKKEFGDFLAHEKAIANNLDMDEFVRFCPKKTEDCCGNKSEGEMVASLLWEERWA